MKKVLLVLLSITLIFSLAGCTEDITNAHNEDKSQHEFDLESIVALIIAGIAFISSTLGTFLVIRKDKKDTFINIITSNRINWMEKTKEMINRFILLTSIGSHMDIKYDQEKEKLFKELVSLKSNLLLHFNPYADIDQKILMSLNDIYWRFELLHFIVEYAEMTDEEKVEFWATPKYEVDIINDSIKIKFYYLIEEDEQKDLIKEAVNNIKVLKAANKLFIEIQDLHNELIHQVQCYLKDEWDRVKNESRGKFSKNKEYNNNKNEVNQFYDYSNNKLLNYIKENFGYKE